MVYNESLTRCKKCGTDEAVKGCEIEWCKECGKPYCNSHIDDENVCDYCLIYDHI